MSNFPMLAELKYHFNAIGALPNMTSPKGKQPSKWEVTRVSTI